MTVAAAGSRLRYLVICAPCAALNADGPAIVDCVVAPNELPNFPHLELDKISNYAMAKIKETMLAVTGR